MKSIPLLLLCFHCTLSMAASQRISFQAILPSGTVCEYLLKSFEREGKTRYQVKATGMPGSQKTRGLFRQLASLRKYVNGEAVELSLVGVRNFADDLGGFVLDAFTTGQGPMAPDFVQAREEPFFQENRPLFSKALSVLKGQEPGRVFSINYMLVMPDSEEMGQGQTVYLIVPESAEGAGVLLAYFISSPTHDYLINVRTTPELPGMLLLPVVVSLK